MQIYFVRVSSHCDRPIPFLFVFKRQFVTALISVGSTSVGSRFPLNCEFASEGTLQSLSLLKLHRVSLILDQGVI